MPPHMPDRSPPSSFRPGCCRTLLQALGLAAVLCLLPAGSLWAQAGAFAANDPEFWKAEWSRTDFSRASVDLIEIRSGGPPRDGIPPIDTPRFESIADAATWLSDVDPVLVLEQKGEARAYPLAVLIWHEIVNDELGGLPVAITFCPLCNAGLAFDRRVDGRVLTFGTTGKLRNSDLVMWDRQTESWWQQMTGEAIVGELTGTRLGFLHAPMVAFQTFRRAHPRGQVLSRDTGYVRPYGQNPYTGYDSAGHPFLFDQAADPRLKALERVVAVELDGVAKAYPYAALRAAGVLADTVAGQPLVVFFQPGTASALDAGQIAQGRDVGAGTVFSARLDGGTLRFAREGAGFRDADTGTLWNQLGQAVEGPLRGRRLQPLLHGNHFAFAWLAFRPESLVYR